MSDSHRASSSMGSGFTIESIEIEGFKGFTSPTYLDFRHRHVFVLGQNGQGKSSIVEAIRWGLFGSTGRSNDIVPNLHYSRTCRVSLKLRRDAKPWMLTRTLNLGTGSSTSYDLVDQRGNKRLRRDIMPRLDSADAGEGTHIIFASQSAPLRRLPDDLKAFEKAILSHLGLTRQRVLLDRLEKYMKNQEDTEHDLDKSLTKTQEDIERQLYHEKSLRNSIVDTPPWGSDPVPSIAMSEQKVRSFIHSVTDISVDDSTAGISLAALLDSAENSLQAISDADDDMLSRNAEVLDRRITQLSDLSSKFAQIGNLRPQVHSKQREVEGVLGNSTIEDLTNRITSLNEAATREALVPEIRQRTLELIHLTQAGTISCPACGVDYDKSRLESALRDAPSDGEPDMNAYAGGSHDGDLQELQSRHDIAVFKLRELNDLQKDLSSLEHDVDRAKQLLSDGDQKLLMAHDIDSVIERHSKARAEMQSRQDDNDQWLASKHSDLRRLVEEGRFHGIQAKLTALEQRKRDFDSILQSYNDFVAFGASVQEISRVADTAFRKQLAQDIPEVSDLLSSAFDALAQHPWYDRLVVSEANLPKLDLRVASSRDSTRREDPVGVLNGQAETALRLAPYFALGQVEDTPTEAYLVMFDDPTRASDKEHMRILVERLYELGGKVQLIVASHETERLREMISQVFDPRSYVVIEPTDWSPDDGPTITISYE